jgi:cell division topological specificity factor
MSKFFGKDGTSASVARDRLMVTLAKERASTAFPYMEEMKRDIIEVIKKYTQVKEVTITTDKNQDIDVIEIDVALK